MGQPASAGQLPSEPQTTGDPTFSPGPWEYVASTEHHGPYVVSEWGTDICDCYTMSNPSALSVRNGGDSSPIHFQHERADANARLIAAAPDLLGALTSLLVVAEADLQSNPHPHPFRVATVREARAAIAKAEGQS